MSTGPEKHCSCNLKRAESSSDVRRYDIGKWVLRDERNIAEEFYCFPGWNGDPAENKEWFSLMEFAARQGLAGGLLQDGGKRPLHPEFIRRMKAVEAEIRPRRLFSRSDWVKQWFELGREVCSYPLWIGVDEIMKHHRHK